MLDDKDRLARLPLVTGSPEHAADRQRVQEAALAHTAAVRELLAIHASEPSPDQQLVCVTCCNADLEPLPMPWPCDTTRALAAGYRFDRPGWREEWAPAGATPRVS